MQTPMEISPMWHYYYQKKIHCKARSIIKEKDGYFIIIKGSISPL